MQRLGSSLITKWKNPFYITLEKPSAPARSISFAGKTTRLEQGCRRRDVKRSETIRAEARMEGPEEGKRPAPAQR